MPVAYTITNYQKTQKDTLGLLKAAQRKHMIHSLTEIDIHQVRNQIRALRKSESNYISFTGYMIAVISKSAGRVREEAGTCMPMRIKKAT
jgi:hypothetical protein